MARRFPSNALAFKRRLLRWFRTSGRDLPWRRTRDPYRIIVSEFMLQQTQVKRVEEFYGPFLERFPSVTALARARASKVREAWNGLGYYRRATNLHRLARTVVTDHAGSIPDDPDVLVTLPGVGRYTAGAVASFAYERRAAAVDTNVERVIRRVFRPRKRTNGAVQTVWTLVDDILPSRRKTTWEFNQAVMDLGATFCTARRPKCPACPVRPACRTGQVT